ncbi:unnamed protein product, partial [Didymodactylos carnosus]
MIPPHPHSSVPVQISSSSQDDGVSMGSPLAPVLANLLIEKLENEHILIPGNDRIIKTWIRYVDDIFVILNGDENDALLLLDTVNQLHKQIKFTLEIEKDGVLAFLDVLIMKQNDIYETTVYRKKTNTNLYMKWDSISPRYQKIALIKSLVTRALRICSNQQLLDIELAWLKPVLNENGYPKALIEKIIELTMKKNTEKDSQKKSLMDTRNESRKFISSLKRLLDKVGIRNIRFGFRKHKTI